MDVAIGKRLLPNGGGIDTVVLQATPDGWRGSALRPPEQKAIKLPKGFLALGSQEDMPIDLTASMATIWLAVIE